MSTTHSSPLSIGIRLGFTTCSAAVIHGEHQPHPEVMANPNGRRVTVCCLCSKASTAVSSIFQSSAAAANAARPEILVGEPAQRRSITFPQAAIPNAPRKVFFSEDPHQTAAAPTAGLPPTLLKNKFPSESSEHVDMIAHLLFALLQDVRKAYALQWPKLNRRLVLSVPPSSQYFIDICELAAHRAIKWIDEFDTQQQQLNSSMNTTGDAGDGGGGGWGDSPGRFDDNSENKKWKIGFISNSTGAIAGASNAILQLAPLGASFGETPLHIALCRIGGSSHSVTIARVKRSVLEKIRHQAGAGDTSAAGSATTFLSAFSLLASSTDFTAGSNNVDETIIDAIIREHRDLFENPEEPLRPKDRKKLLLRAAEAKHLLSNGEETDIEFDASGEQHSFHLDFVKFTQLCSPIASIFEETLKRALQTTANPKSGVGAINAEHINGLIIYGGGAKLPLVSSRLSGIVKNATLLDLPTPQLVAAEGAAMIADEDDKCGDNSSTMLLASSGACGDPETKTNFALLVGLHGDTFGCLLGPGCEYPARMKKPIQVAVGRGEAVLRLVVTKADFCTPLVDIGSCVISKDVLQIDNNNSAPTTSTSAAATSGAATSGAATSGADQQQNSVELFCEVCANGVIRVRVRSRSSKHVGVDGLESAADSSTTTTVDDEGRGLFVFGPIPELRADAQ